MYHEVDFQHPVEYNGLDIYGFASGFLRGMLRSKLKVAQLKEIFGIEIEGPAGRKDTYVKPLEDLIQTCSCFKELLEGSDSKQDYQKTKHKSRIIQPKLIFCLIRCISFHQQYI